MLTMRSDLTTGKRWRSVIGACLSVFLAACATTSGAPPAPEALPRRLVLALDGVDYRDIVTARSRGLFAEFGTPGRLVSTFPSISDIAWHAIFGVQPPAGYQRVFFSSRHNAMVGDALSAIRPIEYEERMDLAFDAKFHHLGAYLMSGRVARREVNTAVETVLRTAGRGTLYVYNIGPDALQHTRGDLGAYFTHLDAKLKALRATYRERTGRDLEIVLLSDHGHNRAIDATFLPVADALRAHGFHSARTLGSPDDVAFSVDGVTTGFGVFVLPQSVSRLVSALVGVSGIDVVTWRIAADTFGVATNTGEARIVQRTAPAAAGGAMRYRAEVVRGDPIGLATTIAAMRRAGAFDADGFASATTWMKSTIDSPYPAAVPRIVHGHTVATRNPAPVLVSIDERFRVGLGLVSVTNRLRPLGGTHGSLNASSSLGVVMSTAGPMADELAMNVRERWGGFADLLDARTPKPSFELTTAAMLRDDPRVGTRWRTIPEADAAITPMVLLTPGVVMQTRWKEVDTIAVTVLRRDGRRVVSRRALAPAAWQCGDDARRCAIPAQRVGLTALTPSTQFVVRVELFGTQGTGHWRRTLITQAVRTASDGVPWSW